jgi:hypothetical protein
MTNAWIEHIKKYAKDNNLSYGCALSTPECKNTYKKDLTKSKKKPECKTCKIKKEPKKPNKQYTHEELLIMAKNIVSYVTGSDQYLSSYDKNWNKKSKEDLLKIVSNFKKKYPDVTIKKTPIKMGSFELLGAGLLDL